MEMVISPESTNFDLANKIIATSTKRITVNAATPNNKIEDSLIYASL